MTRNNTASSCATQWKMWLIKVFSAIYFAAVCAAQEPQNVTDVSPARPLPMSTVPPTVFELPVPILQQQSTWLDVFPSEKVEFSCGVTGSSDWTFTWSRNEKEIQDLNVSSSAGGSVLTITAATKGHSGSYTCKGHHRTKGVTTAASNSLTLTVHENKPQPNVSRSSNFDKMYPGESVSFRCTVNVSSGWEYLWYHKGNEIQAPTGTYTINSIDHANSGQYHCRAKRGKDPFYSEESKPTTLQVSDPPTPSVSLQSPWLDVFENETVELKCEVSGSDWTYTWYKNQELLEEDAVLYLGPEETYLNITSITQAYQGGYACKVHLESRRVSSGFSSPVNVTVYENTPKPTLSKNPAINPMYVGETVNLTCNVDVSWGWEYLWYKDGKELSETSEKISVQLGPSTGGKYSCSAIRGEIISTEISEEIPQDVLEIPVPSLRLMTPWLDVFPAESVKLSCEMGNGTDWIYTWYKDGQKVQVHAVPDSSRATLSISSASAAHAGQYKCRGDLNGRSVISSLSSGLNLSVYDEKPTVTLMQDPDYTVMFPGESVSFTCHINVSSGWEYLWYKGSVSFSVPRNNHTISSVITATYQGSYKCQAKRGTSQVFSINSSKAIDLKVEEDKPKPSMTLQPDVDKVYTGELVSFECKVGLSSGWEYVWYKDKAQLPIISSSFNIHNASLLNSGTYECMATRNKTMYDTQHSDGRILHISEIPVPSVKLMTPWPDVFPGETVKLSCGMDGSSDWTYTWYKDGQKVQADDTVSVDEDATTLSIRSASTSHRGQYSCSGKLKSRSVNSGVSSELTLDVYDTKPNVMLMQNPGHSVMHTGDSVSFSCHINVSSGWEYLWYKDGSPLAESGNNHTISSALTKHTGSYKCRTKRGRDAVLYSDLSQPASLEIKERPKPDIILLTDWSEVFSTDSLVLRCGVQEYQGSWNYTWFKEDQPIDLPPSEKHTVTPQNDPEQSLYTCQGIRSGRPSYSQISDHFKTKNLLLKRRVLLSISGCIFFGIIAVFLGCIILRVIRKPAKDEYKPEEAELFLSMDQIKNCEDAPCPLVQYITDASINASPKEGDENGTICSETTPLPITSQEEQAVTIESQEATENNGELVSFKQ